MTQETVKRLLQRVNNEDSHSKPFSPFIYMVPSVLRNLNPDSFNPQIVSIGPLHREDKNLQAFEGQKISYMVDLLRDIISPQEKIIESCMKKAYELMNKIKASYIWAKPCTYNDAEIAEMMVTDACFILGFMYNAQKLYKELSSMKKVLQFNTIMHDLILLENQIPMFFLAEMFQCTILKFKSDLSLEELLHPLLCLHKLFSLELRRDNAKMSNADHILSFLHQCYMPPCNIKKNTMSSRINSAVDLDMAGVNFKPSEDLEMSWAMGMKMEVKKYNIFSSFFGFWSKPTLIMPKLKVHDATEFVLRNLIAYEQSFHTESYVTAYAITMDMLVNTQHDVAKLVESGVLTNIMGSNEEAANMINNICKNVIWRNSFYEEEWRKLNEYCNGYWPKHIAWLRRTYFNNPWNIIALVAGIILFALQVVQTIFTILK